MCVRVCACGFACPSRIVFDREISAEPTAIVVGSERTHARGLAMDPPPPTPNGGGGFLSNRRIKLTAVFPMIGGSRRTILSKSDSSSLAKTGKATVVAAAAGTATAAERPSHPQQLTSRNRMRRGSSLTDLNRSDSLAGTEVSLTVIPNLTPGLVDLKSAARFCVSVP